MEPPVTAALEPIKRSAPEIAEIKRWLATTDVGHENGLEALMRLSKKRAISEETWGDLVASLPFEEGKLTSALKDKMAERFAADEDAQAEFLNDGDLITDTLLSRACAEGRLAEGRFWASALGADWNPNNGSYPLGWASSFPDLAQALIERGANVNQRTPHTGDTPLFLALAEWAMADRRGEKFEKGEGPAETSRKLLKAGARWSDLSESERGLLATLLGPGFVNGFAAETLGMLSRDLGHKDADGARLRMKEFCAIAQASPLEGFDWASARRKTRPAIATATEQSAEGNERARNAMAGVIAELGEAPLADLQDGRGKPIKTTLLGKAVAAGDAGETGFWADWMGVEWGADIVASEGGRVLQARRPVELAVEFKKTDALKELVGMGATLAGLTADELSQAKNMIGDAALDPIFQGLAENLAEASKESFVDAILDIHEMATRGLVTPERWAALESAMREAIESKINFGYHESAAESLAEMPLSQRGAYPDGSAPVDLYESYQRACESGDMSAARFYARALGPKTPDNASDKASPLVKAISGGRLEIAQMLVDVAKADPTETAALELAARQGRSAEARFLLASGADPARMEEPRASALWKMLRPEHFEELMTEWAGALSDGGKSPQAWGSAVASVLRLDPHGVFGEAHYARFLDALRSGLSQTDEASRADLLKRAGELSLSPSHLGTDGETPLQAAARAGEENKARFWASLRGVEWVNPKIKFLSSPAALALARPDAKMISALLEMGLDPNAAVRESERSSNHHPDAGTYAQHAIAAGKGEALLAFLAAGADPFGESEAWVERARATLRSKPEWAKAAQELTLRGASPAADRLAEEGSLPLAFAERLVESGDLDRFWRLASAFDWAGSTESFVGVSEKARASGIRAYAELKNALANDDLQAARDLIENNANLLPALAKRGMAEKTLLSAVGVGAARLLEAFETAGWPVTAALFKNADAAALSVARSGDASLLAKVTALCAEPLPVSRPAQEDMIVRGALAGGERFVRQLEVLVGGFDPAAVEFAVESLSRSAPDAQAASARALVSMAWEREKEKSKNLSGVEAAHRLQHLTRATGRMWKKLSDESRRGILLQAVEAPQRTFFTEQKEADVEELDYAAGVAEAQRFASSSPEFLSQLMTRASEANQAFLCEGAQLRAAATNDESLALLATRQGKIPASIDALAMAAASDALGALRVFLQSSDPKTLSSLGSVLIARPEARNKELSVEAIALLVDNGAGERAGSSLAADFTGAQKSLIHTMDRAWERLAQSAETADDNRFGPLSWQSEDRGVTEPQRRNIENLLGVATVRAYAPESPDRVAAVLGERPDLAAFASDAVLGSEKMLGKALARDGLMLRHANPVVRANLEVCLKACSQNPDAAAYIHPALARGLDLSLAPEARPEVAKKLTEALAASQSYNPFALRTRLAVGKAQEAALAQAKMEVSQRQREQQVDFSIVYQALSAADLAPEQEASARSALASAHGMAQDKRLILDETDKMLLRRLWEKNIPELLNKMAAIPQAERDRPEPGEEHSPAQVLLRGVADAVTAMGAMRESSVTRAKTALQAEGHVLADKALRQFDSLVDNAAERVGAGSPERETPATPRF